MFEVLIKRLEQTTEPHIELDNQICRALEIKWSADEDGNFGGYGIMPRRCGFTESFDAALSLVPEGWSWAAGSIDHGLTRRRRPWGQMWNTISTEYTGEGETVAIALCISALRARQAMAIPKTPPSP